MGPSVYLTGTVYLTNYVGIYVEKQVIPPYQYPSGYIKTKLYIQYVLNNVIHIGYFSGISLCLRLDLDSGVESAGSDKLF